MSCDVTQIRIEPVNVTWEIEEQWQITCVADVSNSLNEKYIKLSDTAGTVGFWFDTTGTGVEPAGSVALDRSIEVTTIAANDSASTVASKLATAIGADSKFTASSSGAVLTVTSADAADIADWADGNAGFTFNQCQEGGTIGLGLLDGDVEVSFEEQTFEVMAHQTGSTLRADLRQGVSASVALTLKESGNSLRKEMLAKAAGGVFTPGGGTELYGWGDARQGENTVVQARRLIFHPVVLAAGDKSRDMVFWKAYPLPGSITFSGENPEIMAVTFKTYLDGDRPSGINLFAFGDHSQSGITA